MRNEQELIKDYLKSIKFSTNESYIKLIQNYIVFKANYDKSLADVPKETKGSKK